MNQGCCDNVEAEQMRAWELDSGNLLPATDACPCRELQLEEEATGASAGRRAGSGGGGGGIRVDGALMQQLVKYRTVRLCEEYGGRTRAQLYKVQGGGSTQAGGGAVFRCSDHKYRPPGRFIMFLVQSSGQGWETWTIRTSFISSNCLCFPPPCAGAEGHRLQRALRHQG